MSIIRRRLGSMVEGLAGRARGQSTAGHSEPSLTIRLVVPNVSEYTQYFAGNRRRLATVTAVRLLDAHRLVATHLVGKRMFLVRFDFDAGSYTVEQDIPTEFAGEPVITDLLDCDDHGLIAVSDFDRDSVTLYRFDGSRLVHERDIPIADVEAGHCHGVTFVPPGDMICATCTTKACNVYFLSTATGEVLYKFNHGDWRPKDACFIDADRMVVVYAHGSPTPTKGTPYESKAALVRFDVARGRHEFLGETMLPQCQVDCCVHDDGLVYVADQIGDCIRVCRIDQDTITFERRLMGYSFPHGVDVLSSANLMAVTNYGTSDIVLTRLNGSG